MIDKIMVKIVATPAQARPGFAPPVDHEFDCVETADAFPAAGSLVLIRGDTREIGLQAIVHPALTPVWWDVRRAPDDHARVGLVTELPTLAIDPIDHTKVKLKHDSRGSFFVRVFADCNGSKVFDPGSTFRILPFVLAEVTLVQDDSATHTGHILPTIARGSIGLTTGSFDINHPVTEAIHMKTTVDVMSGGPDGRRHLDRVFAGWINNEKLVENVRADYAGAHSLFSVFASNITLATGTAPNGTPLFLSAAGGVPANPAPVVVTPPVLDTGRINPGTGGDTATLTRSRVKSKVDNAFGQRWVVESIDSPGDSLTLIHPGFGTRLQKFRFELAFSAFLSFWANRAGVPGATADPANRVYTVVRSYDWTMLGEWAVDAANRITPIQPISIVMSGATTYSPCTSADRAGAEVCPPTGLSLLALDGRA